MDVRVQASAFREIQKPAFGASPCDRIDPAILACPHADHRKLFDERVIHGEGGDASRGKTNDQQSPEGCDAVQGLVENIPPTGS